MHIGRRIYWRLLEELDVMPSSGPTWTCRRLRRLWGPLRWQVVVDRDDSADPLAELLFLPRPFRQATREAILNLSGSDREDRARCAMLAQLENLEELVISHKKGASVVAGTDVVRLCALLPQLKGIWLAEGVSVGKEWDQFKAPLRRAFIYSHRYTSALSLSLVRAGITSLHLEWTGHLVNPLPWSTLVDFCFHFPRDATFSDLIAAIRCLKLQASLSAYLARLAWRH